MPKLSPLSYKALAKVFEAEGFLCVRIEGDHMVFTKPGILRPRGDPQSRLRACLCHQEQFADGGNQP
ncbi:MAG: hypothetical protein NTZ56_15750 [Acidobacteria bacterium]|nr:hypothetical protein [Acidobacteriota bacterium]